MFEVARTWNRGASGYLLLRGALSVIPEPGLLTPLQRSWEFAPLGPVAAAEYS